MADELKPIRWLGPGVLNIVVRGRAEVFGPSDVIQDALHLAELGPERIDLFLKLGIRRDLATGGER